VAGCNNIELEVSLQVLGSGKFLLLFLLSKRYTFFPLLASLQRTRDRKEAPWPKEHHFMTYTSKPMPG